LVSKKFFDNKLTLCFLSKKNVDSTLFATPPSNNSRDIEVQTIEQVPLPLPVEEIIETPVPSFPPFVDMIFSHMNGVNQWINRFCISNEGIQNDINTIRV
jgi:hypothetical protein